EFTDPEILRTNLASVILQMADLGFAASDQVILDFPFLTPPEARAVRDGRTMLTELGALTGDGTGKIRVTEIGRKLTVLPIDPRLARMVIAGAEAGCGGEVTVIVAALSIQDPRERPAEVRAAADEKHARFTHRGSDFLSYLNLSNYLQDLPAEMSSSKCRRRCKAELLQFAWTRATQGRVGHLRTLLGSAGLRVCLTFVRIREWQDPVGQLRSLLGSAGIRVDEAVWRPNTEPDQELSSPETVRRARSGSDQSAAKGHSAGAGQSAGNRSGSGKIGFAELSAANRRAKKQGASAPAGAGQQVSAVKLDPHAAAIHRALLTGLLAMIGSRSERHKDYQGARGTRFAIFPGSGLFKVNPDFVMAAELVETSRL